MGRKQRSVGIILSYLHLISNALINLAYVPFLIHHLGDGEYGLFQLMGSLIAYFSVFDFGLSNATVRFYSMAKANQDVKKQENVLGTSAVIYSMICLVCCVIGLGIYFLIHPVFGNSLTVTELKEAKIIFLIQLANIIISLMSKIFYAVVTSEERFIFMKTLLLLQCYLQPLAIYCLVLQKPYAITVVIIQSVFNVAMNLVIGWYSVMVLKAKIRFCGFDRDLVKQMLTLSVSVFVVAITDQIFWKTNQFILGAILGTTAVAIYAVAAQLYMNYMVVSSTIQGVFLPRVTQLVAEGNPRRIDDLFVKVGKIQYLLLSLVLIGFISIGQDFVILWVGETYMESYWIALITMVAMTIDLMQCIGSTVLQAQNRYGIRAKVLLVSSVINIMGVLMVARYGGIPCATVSAVCMAIANGPIMNYFYAKVAGLDIKRYWNEIGRISLKLCIVLIMGFLIGRWNDSLSVVAFLLKGILVVGSYGVVMGRDVMRMLSKRNEY